jgi:alkylation response protein AidB-like acyl-CoA dehydrogenase
MTAKLLGHQWAADAGRDAMELHGATAFDEEYPLARLWRDVQHTYPPAGTGEVQRLRLAQHALGESAASWSTPRSPSPEPGPLAAPA